MSQDAIIEKIRKLLRMKRGGTQGEIENALAAAARLAREPGINLDSINPDESAQEIRHVAEALNSRLPLEAKYACAILVNFFNVNVVVSKQYNLRRLFGHQYTVAYIGLPWDTEVARYVFVFLQKHFRSAWAKRANRRLKNRAAFLEGMFLGLAAKLEDERNANRLDEAGLMLIGAARQRRLEYIQKHWPNAGTQDLKRDHSGAHASRLAGVRAGQDTNIRRAVKESPAPARPALPPAKPLNPQLELL